MLSLFSVSRRFLSLFALLTIVCCLLVEATDAQSLERGVRAPKAKFIRFGRAAGGQKFIRFGKRSMDYNDEDVDLTAELEEPEYVPILRSYKRAGQKFIRFGKK